MAGGLAFPKLGASTAPLSVAGSTAAPLGGLGLLAPKTALGLPAATTAAATAPAATPKHGDAAATALA